MSMLVFGSSQPACLQSLKLLIEVACVIQQWFSVHGNYHSKRHANFIAIHVRNSMANIDEKI